MRNCLSKAKVCKIKIQYILDSDPDTKYTMWFPSMQCWHTWLNAKANENKTVLQLLLRYKYEEFPEIEA